MPRSSAATQSKLLRCFAPLTDGCEEIEFDAALIAAVR